MKAIRFIPILVILVAVAVLSVTPALAVKGGNGNGHGGKKLAATLTVEPANPFSAWGQEYTVNGSDFEPNSPVSITMADPGCCLGFRLWTDGDGDLSFTGATGAPGTYTVDAYEWNGHRHVLMATLSFVVE